MLAARLERHFLRWKKSTAHGPSDI
jgi:hypothetical protein